MSFAKISLLCFLGSLVSYILAWKGCAQVLSTLGNGSTEMGIDGKIGWVACVPLFIAGVVFAIIGCFKKEEKSIKKKEKPNLNEKEILEEWDKIEEKYNKEAEPEN